MRAWLRHPAEFGDVLRERAYLSLLLVLAVVFVGLYRAFPARRTTGGTRSLELPVAPSGHLYRSCPASRITGAARLRVRAVKLCCVVEGQGVGTLKGPLDGPAARLEKKS